MVEINPEDYRQPLLELLQGSQHLMLATLNDDGQPYASLAPYLYEQGCLWIFVSRLSRHTANLLQRDQVSVLIHQQDPAANPFVVKRSSIDCRVEEWQQNRDEILDKMTEKLGDTMDLMRQLPDFHLIRLTPQSGQYIAGFGQAFEVDFSSLSLEHINPAKS